MNTITNWFITTIAILLTAYILPGVMVDGVMAAIVAALVLGIINAFLRPVLIILTLPVTVITLGLFSLVINALLIMLTSMVVPGFTVTSFGWAVLFGIALGIVTFFLERMAPPPRDLRKEHRDPL